MDFPQLLRVSSRSNLSFASLVMRGITQSCPVLCQENLSLCFPSIYLAFAKTLLYDLNMMSI